MRNLQWFVLLALAFATASHAQEAARPSEAEQTIEMMDKLWGKHVGLRPVHSKGLVVEGVFVPSAAAAALSKANLFAGPPVPVAARFSDFTGLLGLSDSSAQALPHGMGVRFVPQDGVETDMVANSFAVFPVATGAEFLELLTCLAASGPTVAKPTPLDGFFARHPAAAPALASAKSPTSFARQRFNGLDAFIFIDSSGQRRPFRFRFEPVAGVELISAAAADQAAPGALFDELRYRIAQAPVQFRLIAQMAAPGDLTNDASKAWPDDRGTVILGMITLDSVPSDAAEASRDLKLTPINLAPGIEPSDDPLIRSRAQAYDLSINRRDE